MHSSHAACVEPTANRFDRIGGSDYYDPAFHRQLSMSKFTLISSPTCPYVQRAVIAPSGKNDVEIRRVSTSTLPTSRIGFSTYRHSARCRCFGSSATGEAPADYLRERGDSRISPKKPCPARSCTLPIRCYGRNTAAGSNSAPACWRDLRSVSAAPSGTPTMFSSRGTRSRLVAKFRRLESVLRSRRTVFLRVLHLAWSTRRSGRCFARSTHSKRSPRTGPARRPAGARALAPGAWPIGPSVQVCRARRLCGALPQPPASRSMPRY